MNQRRVQGSTHEVELKEWQEAKREQQRKEIVKILQQQHNKRVEECLKHFTLLPKK